MAAFEFEPLLRRVNGEIVAPLEALFFIKEEGRESKFKISGAIRLINPDKESAYDYIIVKSGYNDYFVYFMYARIGPTGILCGRWIEDTDDLKIPSLYEQRVRSAKKIIDLDGHTMRIMFKEAIKSDMFKLENYEWKKKE